ncbi:heterogeneous nuclear ribonucleoprotein 1, partial [Tanacetum coccineum]
NKFVSNAGQSTSKPEGSESVQKLSTLGTGKPTGTLVSKSTSTNPYARPVIGKCFKCGAPGHRSSECRATGGKINLTTREDDYDEGEEERFDEEIETDVCHPADELDGNLYANDEYSSKLCVIRRIMLAPKLVEKSQRHNLFRTRYTYRKTSKPEGSESVQKLSTLGTGKPTGTLVSKSTSTNSYARPEKSSSTNPYARPVIGKCFKCGAPGHRSSECRATGGKINLTTREDDYDEGEEERFDEEIKTDVCHPADELDGNLYADDEYSSRLCVIRRIMLAPKLVEKSQRHNLFRTRCVIHQRVFDVVIDGDSHENFITQDIVHQLKLPTEKHPLPYNLGKFNVTECCRISFSIGKYKDEMLFDVVDMDACHIILGKPWVYDLNAIYNIEENTYKFKHNGGRFILVPLMECNHVSEPKGKNSFIMRYQDFEEEREDEFLVNSTITTTMIQDETPNKISKNLKSLEEVSQALIPDELQPILSPTQDIPLLNFSGHDIEKEHMVQNMENMEVIHGVKKQHVEFNCEEDDVFEFQQDVLFVLGGNSRTSFFQEGENDAVRVGIG